MKCQTSGLWIQVSDHESSLAYSSSYTLEKILIMIRNFVELFRLSLPHGFYKDGRGRDFVLSPSAATRQIMQKHDLRWGQKQDEFIMLYAREADIAPKLAQLDLPEVLRFFIQSTDPYFFNITKIPFFRSDAELLYFDNLNIETDQSQTISLAQAEKVSKNDLLPLRAASFVFESATGAILALRDVHNQVLVANDTLSTTEPSWVALGQTEHPNAYRVNLRAFPPGKYGLELGADQIWWFYLADPDRNLHDIGVVDIHLGKETAGMLALPPRVATVPQPIQHFQLPFEARATRWRYYVINRSQIDFDRLEVTNVGKEAFRQDPPRLLRSGTQMAIPVFSEQVLLLQERQALKPKLRLVKENTNNGFNAGTTTVDLPTPDGQTITPEEQGNEHSVYSDMYIYL